MTKPLARLLFPAAVIGLVGLIAVLLLATLPSALGYESFVVSAANMQPTLQPGDLAVVSPTRASALTTDEVITYRVPQNPDVALTRRILFVDTDTSGRLTLQVRGDGEPVAEQISIEPATVLGRVVYSIPHLGVLVDFSRGLTGKLLLLVLPALVLTADRLRRRAPQEQLPGVDDAFRISGLITSGRRALAAGHTELALRAAEGALALDQHNRAAWLLKLAATKAREHVAA